jgi:hypothetical protein
MAQTGFTPLQLYYSTTSGNIPSASNLVLGEIALNVADAKLFYKTSGGVVQVLAASDVELKVYNNTGSTIAQGAAVYLSGGASGQTPYISLAIATSQAASNVIGLTTTSISTGTTGYVTTIGLSSTLNTAAFTAGDTLYLSASSAGTLTSTAPASPNYAVRIGFVAYANASGYVFIAKTNAYTNTSSLVGTVSTTNGGTGQSSWTAGQIPYYASGTALNQLTIGTNGQIMTSTGSAPQWSTNLTTAQGGTGLTSFTAGDLTYYATGTTLSKLGIGTAGYFLSSSGSAPQWTQTLAVANGGTGSTTASGARTNLSAAQSGSNTDITSIALTTGTISTAPSGNTDIVNKLYADSIATGVNFHAACNYATIAALSPANTYNNGSSGVGATLTASSNGTLTIDGYTFVVGDVGKRILVKNEVTGANNGAYTLTQAGTASLPYILTRATDYDTSGTGTNEIDQGDFFLVLSGSTNANTSWVQQTALPITVGTTALVFTQFGAGPTYPISVANGGTGATTVAAAQTNLQVDPAGTAIAMAIALG